MKASLEIMVLFLFYKLFIKKYFFILKTIIITEEQKHKLNLLLEDKEGKNLAKARHYLQSNGYSPEQSQKTVDSIRTDIPNSRLQQCKFILGVARLYLDGQLSDGQSIAELNKTLKYIASDAHVNEYDNNLNNESLQVLVNRFKGVARDDLQQSIDKSNARQLTVNQDYTIVPIDNADEAAKYGRYTSWCVTHQSNMYDSYTANGTGRFYFCLRNGFEKEPKVEGKGCPLDKYGLSMIAVSVTMEGEVNTITCRWNHGMGGNDNIMTIEQLEDLLGRNFYQTFKPYSREELHAKGVILFDEVQGLLDSGKNPEEIFNVVDSFCEGFAAVYLNDKWNFLNKEGKLLSNQWFDVVDDFSEGFAGVRLNNKWNYINKDGQFLSNQWFDVVDDFREGFASVYLNDKYNYINKDGQFLSNQWFDVVDDFSEGFAGVRLNNKYNFINRDGQFLSSQWFDDAYGFMDGFASVYLNKKWHKINQKGEIVESKNRNKKTIIITEKQKKKLKKKIAAQDQVGGKVNAGVMDAVVGGMCEDATDDKYVIGVEMNAPIGGVYYHVKEGKKKNIKNDKGEIVPEKCDKCGGEVVLQIHGEPVYLCKDCGKYFGTMPFRKLNESPDGINGSGWNHHGNYPFVKLIFNNKFYVGEERDTHWDLIKKLIDNGEITDKNFINDFEENFNTVPYSYFFDDTMTGRYFSEYNVISFWKTPESKSVIQNAVNELEKYLQIDKKNLLINYWDNDAIWESYIPYTWLFNGTYDYFKGKFKEISPAKPNEYKKTGKYTFFMVKTIDRGFQYADLRGIIYTPMEYYMQASSVNEATEPNRMIDIRKVITSDNFKKWFGDWQNNPQSASKVVDENGVPLIVHHGSPKFEGDRFNKERTGKSINYGEKDIFCTTQDMTWAKRFSYPASPGSYSFTIKPDYSKPGDILSGFLNLRHPLDFFHLTDKDWENIKNMALDTYFEDNVRRNSEEWVKEKKMVNNEYKNHQDIKFSISTHIKEEFGTFGQQLKRYGYDGYIALMDNHETAVEYCFLEPNQFKSIYSFGFNPESESIYEVKLNESHNKEYYHFTETNNLSSILQSGNFYLTGSKEKPNSTVSVEKKFRGGENGYREVLSKVFSMPKQHIMIHLQE